MTPQTKRSQPDLALLGSIKGPVFKKLISLVFLELPSHGKFGLIKVGTHIDVELVAGRDRLQALGIVD